MSKSDANGSPAGDLGSAAFRFFDNREKYLMFVNTCSEKEEVAATIGRNMNFLEPSGSALRIFDAGVGDGTVLCHLLRDLHGRFPNVPFLVVGKEISMEDVRITLEKLPDRFHEHPEMVVVLTNLYYSEAPKLRPNSEKAAEQLAWKTVALDGHSSHDFGHQIRELRPFLADHWQVRRSKTTGNPLYDHPAVLVLYRRDRHFILNSVLPGQDGYDQGYDLIAASQPYRSRMPADFKVRNVIGPLARALAPGGQLITVQSYGRDPGMEIIDAIWPGSLPFKTDRHELIAAARAWLNEPEDKNLAYYELSDADSLFRYHLHTLPSEVGSSIGTSTLLAAWNAAVYVAQIEDDRLADAMAHKGYLEATRAVLARHGGLWFNDETFIIRRERS
ncbi:MAG: hypothetical protein AAF530_03485 [Pseudomonadota bacterium]